MQIQLKGEAASRRVWLNGREITPERSQQVLNHSADGFAWGYGGSGPAQLALAICLELGGMDDYQLFKWDYLANIPQGDFDITIDFDRDKYKLPEH